MVIRPLSIDELAVEFAQAKPFPFVQVDGFLDPDFAREVAAATPRLTDARRISPPLRQLVEHLHSPAFLHTLGRITGIDNLLVDERMLGGGLHQAASGSRLDVHVDFNYLPDVKLFRRLNLLLYLNPEWHASWGGELELYDAKACHHALAPILGRCVILGISGRSFHGTARVNCPPQVVRSSIALYYYTREAPSDFAGEFHGPARVLSRARERSSLDRAKATAG
jgi:2OG-Fe(II) oxygenase superfamily